MIFRVARHTTNLDKIIYFYRDVLGFDVLGSFENHSTYDGVFLGIKNESWHLEYTVSSDPPIHTPDDDDLLVFYPTEIEKYKSMLANIQAEKIQEVEAKNPYWKINGRTFVDPDGFRIVISNLKIK